MARKRNIREFAKYIKQTRSAIVRGHSLALIEIAKQAEDFARENITKMFGTGSHNFGRRLAGRLMNSIFSEFKTTTNRIPQAFIGTRGIPYGQIEEQGGVVKPVRANHLWVKTFHRGRLGKMTPREFMTKMRQDKRSAKKGGPTTGAKKRSPGGKFVIFMSKKGNLIAAETKQLRTKTKIKPLFWLKDEVRLKPKKYLFKAALRAGKNYKSVATKHINEELKK